ncbi:hypothetical protein RRG08_002673 [Elysia crispata]|uniref:Uncharacterized protein n=1 Tax=Elysia crispata TaxID=231223 RepID=A0AAE1CML3_9GAST|nr:hypothetical protein RRG08_002673 [Elysia crispata]
MSAVVCPVIKETRQPLAGPPSAYFIPNGWPDVSSSLLNTSQASSGCLTNQTHERAVQCDVDDILERTKKNHRHIMAETLVQMRVSCVYLWSTEWSSQRSTVVYRVEQSKVNHTRRGRSSRDTLPKVTLFLNSSLNSIETNSLLPS